MRRCSSFVACGQGILLSSSPQEVCRRGRRDESPNGPGFAQNFGPRPVQSPIDPDSPNLKFQEEIDDIMQNSQAANRWRQMTIEHHDRTRAQKIDDYLTETQKAYEKTGGDPSMATGDTAQWVVAANEAARKDGELPQVKSTYEKIYDPEALRISSAPEEYQMDRVQPLEEDSERKMTFYKRVALVTIGSAAYFTLYWYRKYERENSELDTMITDSDEIIERAAKKVDALHETEMYKHALKREQEASAIVVATRKAETDYTKRTTVLARSPTPSPQKTPATEERMDLTAETTTASTITTTVDPKKLELEEAIKRREAALAAVRAAKKLEQQGMTTL